jgi:hypothetical protein
MRGNAEAGRAGREKRREEGAGREKRRGEEREATSSFCTRHKSPTRTCAARSNML